MSHSSALREDAPANRVLRVLVATLMALIPLLSASVMGAAPASATTAVSGSIDPANGFPTWYEDAAGNRVVPCLDPADPNCVLAGFTPNGPVSFPDNFPGEFFYTIADSNRITTNGCKGTKRGTVSIRFAVEGTFATATGAPAVGQQIVFARTRIRVTSGLCPNTTYQFVHPFGTTTLTTDSAGAIPANVGTVDVGCAAVPCAFTSPLFSPIFGSAAAAGSGFLRWDPTVAPSAPAGYLGDGATPHAVTGGTNGNVFEVRSAAGVPEQGLSTNLFAVSGKLAGSLAATPSSVDFGGQPFGTTSAPRTITVTNLDSATVSLADPALSGEFSRTGGTCVAGLTLARDAACTVDVAFAPTLTTGARAGTLTVASTDGVRSPLTVALVGTATTPTDVAVLTRSVETLAFGDVRVREASAPETVTLTNSGTAPLTITSIALDPGASAEENANFRIVGGSCSTTVSVLEKQSCTIEAAFAPLSNGSHATAIVVATNAGAGSVGLTGTGTGGTAAVGPVGAFGFPEWYRDDTGIKVGQCIDPADPYCIVLPDAFYDPANPLVFPDNFPEEFFYQVADTETDIADQTCNATPARVRMRTAVEAAFANGGPVDGDQMTFGRIRFSANGGLCPDTDYYFTSPYGSDLFTSDADGVLKPAAGTQDVGCVPTPGTPCDWELALSSRVLSSLVRWDPAVGPQAPAGYLGDAATLHKIVGAPYMPDGTTPANYFKVTRADTGEQVAFIDDFTVMGKLQGPLEATPSTVDFGGVPTGTSSAATPFTLVNTGLEDITIAALANFVITGANAADFAVDPGACAAATLVPAGTCAGTVTFTPAADGPREAHLAVAHDGLNTPLQIRLVGVGQAQAAAFTASPTSVTFGPVHVGQPSEVEKVTISNVGGLAPLSVTAVDLVGLEAPQYAIVGNTCMDAGLPVEVPVDGSCAVDVVFTPLEAGASQVALEFTDNATASPQSILLNATASSAVPVDAALIHPNNGFPMYYRDGNGLRVEPCINPSDTRCVLAGFDAGGNPVTFPTNFPDEFFYSIADSDDVSVAPIADCTSTPTPGTANLRVALEGSFANGAAATAVAGDQITFGRTRITASGLCPSTAYTFVTPYGPVTHTTDALGDIAPKPGTTDIGSTPFSGALAAPIAASFPRWNPNVAPAAPAGYLGDPLTLHRIVGGTYVPAGAAGAFNGFEVRDAAANVLGSTDKFLVAGKLAASLHTTGTAMDFGDVNINVTSAPQTVTLTNTGPPVAITALGVQPATGTAVSEFVVGGTCEANLTLATDETCTVVAQFAPVQPTGPKSATVTVTPASGAAVVVGLTGTANATGLPVASVSPTSLAFGSVNVGTPSTLSVTVTNTGSGDLHVSAGPTITGGTAAADYRVSFNDCATVTPTKDCRIAVTFTPTAAGSRTATLTIKHDTAGSPSATDVPLTGTGVASTFSVTPTSVKFGKVRINTSKTGSVTVKNTGTIAFTPTKAEKSGTGAAMFSVLASPNCLGVPLAPGRTCSVNIQFSPTTTGNFTASLTVFGDTSSIPTSRTVTMTGTGQ